MDSSVTRYTRMLAVSFLRHDPATVADESGQGLMEYALILALVAVACVGALAALAPPISAVLNSTAGHL